MQPHVTAGQPVDIEAKSFNCMLDAAEFVERATQGIRQPSIKGKGSGIRILIRNDTGGDLDRYAVVSPTGPLFEPDAADEVAMAAFQDDDIVLKCVAPTSDDATNFVILDEPIVDGGIGYARIIGLAIVEVEITLATATTCGADTAVTANLTDGAGSTTILWKESGTGTKWAVVLLGGAGAAIQKATLSADLTYASSATAVTTGGTITVHDWLLSSGESLSNGTRVIVAMIEGEWIVIQARC